MSGVKVLPKLAETIARDGIFNLFYVFVIMSQFWNLIVTLYGFIHPLSLPLRGIARDSRGTNLPYHLYEYFSGLKKYIFSLLYQEQGLSAMNGVCYFASDYVSLL
jgi:hypothetical protein